MADSKGLVWRLELSGVRDARCWVTEAPSALIAVRVTYGDETILDEMYPDIRSAMARADRLRSNLVNVGWKVMPEQADHTAAATTQGSAPTMT